MNKLKDYKNAKYPFEKYLEYIFCKENPQILDDDLPDSFDNWLTEMEGEDYIKHGNAFSKFLLDSIK